MEEERTNTLTIFDLIQRARPLTAASSLVPRRPVSTLDPRKNSDEKHHQKPSSHSYQNTNLETLKPLDHPMLLIGVLSLPSFAKGSSSIQCNCFQFSDGSATVCCDLLNFDPKMIDQRIRVLAWNFIPLKCGDGGMRGGFLEIITWDFLQACCGNVCSLPDFSSFCLTIGACDVKDKSSSRCLFLGVIESISPVSSVPCAGGGSGSRNINGFLVNILVCQCKLCASKLKVAELKDLSKKTTRHSFSKMVIVYFCGSPSSWHPVISRLVGDIVLLTGLKKKMVFISKEQSQLMYVTTYEVSLHVAKLFKGRGLICNNEVRGEGESGRYVGIITGCYMQGMVVELDRDVILLLTDRHLTVPHSIRIGAIATLKNVHFVDPEFRWGKMLILGACCRTTVYVESFSPLETGCHLKSYSQSPLQKFIDSLSFAPRLWALLVISCFRKKFAGTLSSKEIVGSKHCSQKEGLAQKYVSSHLPLSAFRFRHGPLLEFCKHDLCSVGKEERYRHLRLVLPITNLISYCEASWRKILDDEENLSDLVCGVNQKKPLSCGGRSYVQPVRRVLCTEEVGIVVLGTLKISSSSGRLQLVDATGGVDIIVDLPTTWNFGRIFEANNFRLIMEGIPPKLVDMKVDLDSTIYQPLSCRSIFSDALSLRKMKTSVYLYHCPDDDSWSRSLFFDWKENSQELENGKFHLFILTHKYPLQQKFRGDLARTTNIFAQAIVLPWDLLVGTKNEDTVTNIVSSRHWKDSLEIFTRPEKHHSHKRCKVEQASAEAPSVCLNDARNELSGQFISSCSTYRNSCTENTCGSNHQLELPCLIACKGLNFRYHGLLHCINEHGTMLSGSKPPKRKVLLEFSPDSHRMYEVLKIGSCYLVKHQEEDMICRIKQNYQVSRAKVFINSVTHVRNVRFSSIETLQSSDVFPSCNLHIRNDEIISKGQQQYESSDLTGNGVNGDMYSDVNVYVPSTALILLEDATKLMDSSSLKQRDSSEQESDIHDRGESMIIASMESSGTPCYDHPLPSGNLITLFGLVLAFHDCAGDSFPRQSTPIPGEGYLPKFFQENGGLCFHVLVDNQIVRIICDLSKQNLPIGLGTNVYATFHRVLVLRVQNKYMMTPVSFITIKGTSLMHGHLSDEFNNPSGTVGLLSVASSDTVPRALISQVLQSSELKPIKFRCRVIAVYILVIEKARTSAISQSSISSALGIPFAGFVLDDGSSSCCCWADSERAAALLGLEAEEYLLKDGAQASWRSKAGKRSTVSCLDHILEKHRRVVVKNYGPIFGSSCQELAFSVNSNRLLSSADEDLLTSSINDALLASSWTIIGSLMDRKATKSLEERIAELDVVLPPQLDNIWVTSVCHTDMLAEARNIIQEFDLT